MLGTGFNQNKWCVRDSIAVPALGSQLTWGVAALSSSVWTCVIVSDCNAAHAPLQQDAMPALLRAHPPDAQQAQHSGGTSAEESIASASAWAEHTNR